MLTWVLMALIGVFLLCELVIGAKYKTDAAHLFNLKNTNSMRGFWCLIILMVHVPVSYQNQIQDLIGSFAYIGVTFFFMTSAFGLCLSEKKNPMSTALFWKKRLPKLLIPCFVTNYVIIAIGLIQKQSISLQNFLWINPWVRWLFVCYFVFWACHKFVQREYQDILTCIIIAAFSVCFYLLGRSGITESGGWCSEVFGFIWGILLFHNKEKFILLANKFWTLKSIAACIIAGGIGVAYLAFKPVPFLGDYFLKIFLGVTIILFILFLNIRFSIGNRVSAFLGDIFFEIYLLHGSVFKLVNYFVPKINSGLFILISICITVAISAIVYRIDIFVSKKIKVM